MNNRRRDSVHINTKNITSCILICMLLVGCAGRTAAPVMVHQYGDGKKDCETLKKEIDFTENEIFRLIPESEKTGSNVALGVAGAFLIFPWFFMDFSEAEQIEINALRQRYNHLVILSEEKDCGFEKESIPDFKQQQDQKTEKKEVE